MSDDNRFCSDEKLLLAFHRALSGPLWLRVQLHRFVCSSCRGRYRELGQTSLALRDALAGTPPAHVSKPGVLAPILIAALCVFALTALAWSARVNLLPSPDAHLTDSDLLAETKRCEPTPSEP